MTPPPTPTKRINVVVKKHVIKVPTGKPTNGGSAGKAEAPPEQQNLKRGFFSRCIDVIKEDVRIKVLRAEATVKETDPNFEDYVRFLELAKKGK